MCSLARLIVLNLVLLVACAFIGNPSSAQEPAKKPGSFSGRVTVGGKPLPRAIVMLIPANVPMPTGTPTLRGTTDEDGRYRITGIPPGTYRFMSHTPALVVEGGDFRASPAVTVSEGENVEDVNIALKKGGVVTGRVADAEGRPVVAQRVNLTQLDEKNRPTGSPQVYGNPSLYSTDDRGVYRIFGLAPGRYKASVGEGGDGASFRVGYAGARYRRTFHPDVTDEARATIVSVSGERETTGVDIVVHGSATKLYTATGRIIDAETGEPVPNARFGHGVVHPNESPGMLNSYGTTSNRTNANGEFRIDGLAAGRYAAFAIPEQPPGRYSEATPFEVSDTDVSEIEIRLRPGSTISGVIMLDGSDDPEALARLGLGRIDLRTHTMSDTLGAPAFSGIRPNPDGSFQIIGLRPGRVSLYLSIASPPRPLAIVRIEREGVEQPGAIEVGAGENLTGVRLIVAYGAGVIRGQLTAEGGLPAGAQFQVMAFRSGMRNPSGTAHVDIRGRFVIEGLASGEYEVRAMAYVLAPPLPPWDGSPPRPSVMRSLSATQNVTVTSGRETELTLELAPVSNGENR